MNTAAIVGAVVGGLLGILGGVIGFYASWKRANPKERRILVKLTFAFLILIAATAVGISVVPGKYAPYMMITYMVLWGSWMTIASRRVGHL